MNQEMTGRAQRLTEEMEALVRDPVHPLGAASIGIVKDGRVLFAHTCGMKRLLKDGTVLPADVHTKFRMASISKLVTATAVWQLIEQGKLNPDGDASDALGFTLRNPSHPGDIITLRHLLSHTSSIREGSDEDTVPYVLPYGHRVSEFFEPDSPCYCKVCWAGAGERVGDFFSYANINYGLLGTAVEHASGERFDRYVSRHIFEPLGLDCGFYLPGMSASARSRVGTIYRRLTPDGVCSAKGDWVPQVDDAPELACQDSYADYRPGSNATLFSPQGGMRASLMDLLTLMQAWMQGGALGSQRILQKTTVDAMCEPVWRYDAARKNGDSDYDRAFASGPQVFTGTMGADRLFEHVQMPAVGHSAGAYGLLGILAMDRENGNGVVAIDIGTGSDPDGYRGHYSDMDRWRERLLTLACDFAGFSPDGQFGA